MIDKNCLSYWFPILEAAGVPVPRTEIVRTDLNLVEALDDGVPPLGFFTKFIKELSDAAMRIDKCGPWFLRTGQGSGKHSWEKTCCMRDVRLIHRHVISLIEWSETVDMLGLKSDVWAVREFLTSDYIATLPAYGNMPLVPEWRFFIRDGKVECEHPYWPFRAIEKGMRPGCYEYADHCHRRYVSALLNLDLFYKARRLAQQVADSFDGYWSVDIIHAHKGLFVTDMAEGDRSWHWPDCKHGKNLGKEPKNESQTPKDEVGQKELPGS